MFERFTDRARRVIVLAQEDARKLNHNYIGVEHLILGLLREDKGIAAVALKEVGITMSSVLDRLEPGERAPSGHIPFTPRSKRVMELALREGLQLAHNYIGTEHLLLGLVRDGGELTTELLGGDLNRVRIATLNALKPPALKNMHIVGIRDRNDQWLRMKSVYLACVAAQIEPPNEVVAFFDGAIPSEEAPVDLDGPQGITVDWTCVGVGTGVELTLADLPEGVTKLRIYMS